jgi:hypothetical protein
MKPRSPQTYIDDFIDYLNRLLARVGFLRGWLKANIHHGQVAAVELKLLPPQKKSVRPCLVPLEELTELFQERLRKTLKLKFDFGRVEIEIDQGKIKKTFFTILSLPEEKGYMGLVFRPAPARKLQRGRVLVSR